MPTTTTELEFMSLAARELANKLFSSKEAACTQNVRCLEAEEDRPLTKEERRQGWARRPFWAYSSDRMCAGCQAYFHAERAAQLLHEMRCWQIRIEADTARRNAK